MSKQRKVNVDNLLNDLFHKLEHGVLDKKTGKKSKAHRERKTLRDESTSTFRLAPETLKPTKLILIDRKQKCQCCGQVAHHSLNPYVLVERKDKHGNVLRNRFFTKTEIETLPRVVETRIEEIAACVECFLNNPHSISPVVEPAMEEAVEMIGTDVVEELIEGINCAPAAGRNAPDMEKFTRQRDVVSLDELLADEEGEDEDELV